MITLIITILYNEMIQKEKRRIFKTKTKSQTLI